MDKVAELIRSMSESEPWYICDVVANHVRKLWGAKALAEACDKIDDSEYVTLDAVLGRGRHEDESGVNLGEPTR